MRIKIAFKKLYTTHITHVIYIIQFDNARAILKKGTYNYTQYSNKLVIIVLVKLNSNKKYNINVYHDKN